MWESGRQHSHRSVAGSTSRPARGGAGRCGQRVVGVHDALRHAGAAAGGHDEGVAVLDRTAAGEGRSPARSRRRSGRGRGRRGSSPPPAPAAGGRSGAPRRLVPTPARRVSTNAWPVRATATSSRIGAEARAGRRPARIRPPPPGAGKLTGHERLDRRRPAPHPARRGGARAGRHRGRGRDGRRHRRPQGPDHLALRGRAGRVARPPGRRELRQRLLRRRAGHRRRPGRPDAPRGLGRQARPVR